jgi:transposase-like protein
VTTISYSGYRFPVEIIQNAICTYLLFTLSYRDVSTTRSAMDRSETMLQGPVPASVARLRTK